MTGLSSSFRDCDGFVFARDGKVLRRINPTYAATYRRLEAAGLLSQLWAHGRLIPHQELSANESGLVLEPEQLTAILYPYEWCFGQLQEAALLTLDIQKAALAAGFSLKDASAYNVQFHQGCPLLIDTLSFEPYVEGRPWIGYRQFCQHFLAPLALMSPCDPRLGLLARNHIDGVPLDLASRLLPRRTWLNLGLLFHVHLHARAQGRYQNRDQKIKSRPITRNGLLAIVENLASTVRSLKWTPAGTEWAVYYEHTNYDQEAKRDKIATVDAWLKQSQPRLVWDLGANDGTFSRLAVVHDATTVAWNLAERMSLFERNRPDLVLALTLLHHLAIGNNVPLDRCADFFRRVSDTLIIERGPKTDSKVAALLRNRTDIFADYNEADFTQALTRHYRVSERHPVNNSERVLYFLQAT